MRLRYLLVPVVLLVAACDSQARSRLRELAHTDSLRTDSILAIKNDLLNEVMASTQFVNELNTEIAKVKSRTPLRLASALSNESEMAEVREERAAVLTRIRDLVARLDSSEHRVASLRSRAAALARHDSTIVAQVLTYEKTIMDLQRTVERQRSEYEATIAAQSAQIATLTSRMDTVTRANLALTDTMAQLLSDRNAAYYVIGTKDELVKAGVLVEEGHRRFLILGGRPLSAARELDPAKFTRIDRLKDRVITFPPGSDYTIFSRQNASYASPFAARDGRISGGLRIDEPDRFWEPSKFLIILKS